MACIYQITNLINNKIYIGKTHKDATIRYREHWYEAKSKSKARKTPLHKAFLKYGKDNFKLEVLENGDYNELQLNEFEKYYIAVSKSLVRGIGYNMTPGGESFPKDMWTTERRLERSKSIMGANNPMYGRSRTGEEMNDNQRKIILQYDLNGNFIAERKGVYKTAREMSMDYRGLARALKGEYKTYKGFIWKNKV